jgi:hypothetical protein
MRRLNLARAVLLGIVAWTSVLPLTGCKEKNSDKTTIKVDGPKSEHKITIEHKDKNKD